MGGVRLAGVVAASLANYDLVVLTARAYRHVIPNGTYHFPRAIEGDNLS